MKVLYIAGCDRSGSTLVGRLLGEVSGFTCCGELALLWERGLKENRRCGCGEPFEDCQFWQTVVEALSLDSEEVDVNRICEFLSELQYENTYEELLINLYREIYAASNAEVIVDTSKVPRYAHLLANMEEIDLRILHLIRDPRGVAHSLQKRKTNPAIPGEDDYMVRKNLVQSVGKWSYANLTVPLLRQSASEYTLERYEDLAKNPRYVMERLLSDLDFPEKNVSWIDRDDCVTLHTSHTVSGNPMRFKTGTIQIYLDQGWKTESPSQKKFWVTVLSLPLLLYFYSESLLEY